MNTIRNSISRLGAMSSAPLICSFSRLAMGSHVRVVRRATSISQVTSGAAFRTFSSCSNGSNGADAESLKFTLGKIDEIVKNSNVVLFMKGKPTAPLCGYSKMAATILAKFPIQISAIDVLENDAIRQAIKQYSSWPTIPQVYIKGEFVGGADILVQMYQSGELHQSLLKAGLIPEQSNSSAETPQK